MDEETTRLLEEWGFEKYVEKFKSEEVDYEALRELTPQMIAHLIPTIGGQSKFSKLHKQHFNPQTKLITNAWDDDLQLLVDGVLKEGSTEVIANCLAVGTTQSNEQLPTQPRTWNDVDNDVARYLKNDKVDGFPLLEVFKKRPFTKSDRCKLSKVVIKGELGDDSTKVITGCRLTELASQFPLIFPGEKASFYYIEAQTSATGERVSPKGPLYNCYINTGRLLRQVGVRPSIRRPSSERILCQVSEKASEAHAFVQKYVTPWKRVESDWSLCHEKRRDDLLQPTITHFKKKTKYTYAPKQNENSIHVYINSYPPLTQPLGIFLLEQDFHQAYPTIDGDALSTNWEQLLSVVRVMRPEQANMSNDLDILKLFATLFDPFTINGKNKSSWRPSRSEIIEGFILHVQVISEVEVSLKRMKEKLSTVKKTLQPIPVIVGSANESPLCYVLIENIRYTAPDVRKALDLCFKSYHALHAEYPVQSAGPWLLLQKGVYKLDTQWDHENANVEQLLSYFKNA